MAAFPKKPKSSDSSRTDRPLTALAALTALGIVYGDLGTSPLYTLQTIVQIVGGKVTAPLMFGILSLIIWALILIISIKYCLFVMRADNNGEGGILILTSLLGEKWSSRRHWLLIAGLFGAAFGAERGRRLKHRDQFLQAARRADSGGHIAGAVRHPEFWNG
jgi:K+ transporter